MNLFDVYSRLNIEPVSGDGVHITDSQGNTYLDFYTGHGVVSIGHAHPHFVYAIKAQLERLPFYSNSVLNPVQEELAWKLGEVSGLRSHDLFLCNSGAEANENALKLAAFHTGRSGVIAFKRSFHGRTSAALDVTDNDKIRSPLNDVHNVTFLPLNDLGAVENELSKEKAGAVIIEGIQGIAGVYQPSNEFLTGLEGLCRKYGAMLILDEVQSGYGRTGKFFAFQHAHIEPHLITCAKGMGNGFPMGGVLIDSTIKPTPGLLGTTFGGGHLACAAGLAVLDVIEESELIINAGERGALLRQKLQEFKEVSEVRGIGLMVGMESATPAKVIRETLLYEHKVITGTAWQPNTLRLLPPLSICKQEIEQFLDKLSTVFLNQFETI